MHLAHHCRTLNLRVEWPPVVTKKIGITKGTSPPALGRQQAQPSGNSKQNGTNQDTTQ
jgi:hypothetical protein